jgi:ribonuclease-3
VVEPWEHAALERKLEYEFNLRSRLIEALTHRTYAEEHPECRHNGRLAFLGDAVLQLIITQLLIGRASPGDMKRLRQGVLTEKRQKFVNNERLANMAETLGIIPYTGDGEAKIVGDAGEKAREKRLASAFEALVGAVYEENGRDIAVTTEFVRKLFERGTPTIWD